MNTLAARITAFALAATLASASHASEHWATAWYASPQPGWGPDFVLPTGVPPFVDNQTVSESLRLSAGGRRVQLVFSNRYGHAPVAIGAVRVAGTESGPGPAVTFGGQPGVTLAPGAQAVSDPVALATAPLSQLTVRSYYPRHTPVDSFHWGGQQTLDFAAGDQTAARSFHAGSTAKGRLFLSGVLVETASAVRTVVTLGDSITDGNGSAPDANRRWPDVLAQRLARRGSTHGVAVANAGISGARLLRDGMGVSALARVEQDVYSQPGVTDLIVLLGINDIGWPGSPFAPAERPVTLDELTTGYLQLIAGAHARGIRVMAGTLPPFEDALQGTPFAGHYSAAKEQLRQQLNEWIRHQPRFDSVADFDAVLRDPAHPARMQPRYDSGDHLHPGDAGYQAMAEAINLAALAATQR